MSIRNLACAASLALCFPAAAHAQNAGDFYKGKNVDLYVGYSVGGGYDLYARVLARHLSKHIPGNPNVVPKNMEGAGSLRLANWLYRVAPKDGTVIGTIGRGTGFDPLLGQAAAQFDGTKFNWIGSAANEVSVCVSWAARSPVKSFDDLMTKGITVGGTSASADTDQFPRIMNSVLGTKMKIITGYPGGNDVALAMERGEVEGRCGWSWTSLKGTHPDWLRDKKVNVFVQLALAKNDEIPDTPLITDLAQNDEQRQILRLIFARQVMGRPYLAPPGVPPERVAVLRKAFADTMADKAFLDEAGNAGLEITPVTGEDLQKLVGDIYATPPDVAKKAAAALK